MNGILILAHGSRYNKIEDTMLKICDMVKVELKSEYDATLIGYAFLQYSQNNLETGIKKLIDQGVSAIQVMPYFLFDGAHILDSIPTIINKILKDNPGVEIRIGQTLGTDERLAQIIVDRVREMSRDTNHLP